MTEPAYERIDGAGPLLFLCDHASSAVPAAYGWLGLDADLFKTHIAYDIGAAGVTRALASAYGAPAVLGRWSRLLVDLNRGPDDPTLVMKLSDGSIIPGNRDAGEAEIAQRIRQFHEPYHRAIESEIERLSCLGDDPPALRARSAPAVGGGSRPSEPAPLARSRAREGRRGPILISLHSFTPSWKGKKRPWEVGVLWDRDGRLAKPLMKRLAEAGFAVGDNEPYSGALENDCLNRHGTRRGLPHVLIEIRQDLIADQKQAQDFAGRLTPVLDRALTDMEI
jgi:predicted N-formylglutamate amidohydrolase